MHAEHTEHVIQPEVEVTIRLAGRTVPWSTGLMSFHEFTSNDESQDVFSGQDT